MFKLASLVAVAAASTASKDEAKAKAGIKKTMKGAVTGSSKITKDVAGWEMPDLKGVTQTYADVEAHPTDNCFQCVFSGGDWANTGAKQTCTYSAAQKTAIEAAAKSAKKDKAGAGEWGVDGMDAPAQLSADVTFKQAFAGMEQCVHQGTTAADVTAADAHGYLIQGTKADGEGYSAYNPASTYVCKTSFDLTSFKAGKATGKKGDKPAKWDYTWATQNSASAGEWCYFQTYLPKSFSGGLIMTNTQDKDTQVIAKVHNTVDRYFSGHTMGAMAIGKTGKVPLFGARKIDIIMQQANVYSATADKATNFDVTFERQTYMQLTELTVANGGAVVWIIIGCVVCCLIVTIACLWKCHKDRQAKKEEEDQFYQDDLYARV